STRSGRSSSARRSTASRRTRGGATAGTTPPSTRRAAWSSAWSSASERPRRGSDWAGASSGGRGGGPVCCGQRERNPASARHAPWGRGGVPQRTGRPGRPRKPHTVLPPEVTYATIHKHRENDRVVRVSARVVFGTLAAAALALLASAVSRLVNTSFVERHNGT